MPDIRLENVTLSLGQHLRWKDLSLTLKGSTCTALVGPSGAGKTTLLRLVAGLQPPRHGQVTGIPVGRVSFLFQDNRLFPWLNVEENINMILPAPLPEHQMKELLSLVELQECGALYPSQLSGGMQRRVALARALAFDFDLLLLDEPFTGVDEACRDRILHRLYPRLQGKTVLLISHDRNEVRALAQNAVFFEAGENPYPGDFENPLS